MRKRLFGLVDSPWKIAAFAVLAIAVGLLAVGQRGLAGYGDFVAEWLALTPQG